MLYQKRVYSQQTQHWERAFKISVHITELSKTNKSNNFERTLDRLLRCFI